MSIRSKVWRELSKRPQRMKELKAKLGNDRKVQKIVEEMVARGRIRKRAGIYYLADKERAEGGIACRLVKLGPSFGFAQPLKGESRDVFIPGRGLAGAMPGDEVLVKLFDKPRVPGTLEGEIRSVLKPRQRFVGTVEEHAGRLFLAPDECSFLLIAINKSAAGGARPGDKAAIELLERGFDYGDHRAGVTMRFGSADEARHSVQALVYASGMGRLFSDKVKEEARRFGEPGPAEIENRLDLRQSPIFTLDGADTKDMDDAISVERTEKGYKLGVHIADVSFYVAAGGELDKEAFTRGASVYYADSVIPMLPKYLANDLCSLNPQVDRLAFSCLMELDENGAVTDFRFCKSVICSRVKGVYSEVNRLLAGEKDPELEEKYREVASQLPIARQLYEKLLVRRRGRGYIELESDEAGFVMDERGRCVDIVKRERGVAERVIEEFMLLANECAAKLARTRQLPLVYRVHEPPEAERIERLQLLLNSCGVPAGFENTIPTQKELSALLEKAQELPCCGVVNQGVLRSMSKARYEEKPLGHFGLALEDYAHFTSPIRRYPDLVVHRILSDWCAGMPAEELHRRYDDFVQEASAQSSSREVAILQLERAAEGCYKAEYIRGHLGEEFDGVISGVAKQGVYVALPCLVEGLVRTEALCKGEPELVEGLSLRDPLTGKRWQLGQPIRIRVDGADVAQGRVDFSPVE